MGANRWEVGSDFDFPSIDWSTELALPTHPNATLWHSGRDALIALLTLPTNRFRRVLVPSYYCAAVNQALMSTGAHVVAYPDAPGLPVSLPLGLRAGDAVLIVNTFGLRATPNLGEIADEVTIIEDHSHDPFSRWATESAADYCFASLRKWLPLPDGGIIWSNRGREVPAASAGSTRHQLISLAKTIAMQMKAAYLNGNIESKDGYRSLFGQAESAMGSAHPGPMSASARQLLAGMPISEWRARRHANWLALSDQLQQRANGRFRVLTPEGGCVPFAACLVLDDPNLRSALLDNLRGRNVYPAILWPIDERQAEQIDGMTGADVSLSRRILALHCDHRYSVRDMELVATAVSEMWVAA